MLNAWLAIQNVRSGSQLAYQNTGFLVDHLECRIFGMLTLITGVLERGTLDEII